MRFRVFTVFEGFTLRGLRLKQDFSVRDRDADLGRSLPIATPGRSQVAAVSPLLF